MRSGQPSVALWLTAVLVALLLQLLALPDLLAGARPFCVLLVLSCWAYLRPGTTMLVVSFVAGLALDISFGTVLGQHALANVLVIYLAQRLRSFFALLDTWQVMLLLAPLWTLYAFMLFWLDGLTDRSADPLLRWLPILSTTLLWPVVLALMAGLLRPRRDDR